MPSKHNQATLLLPDPLYKKLLEEADKMHVTKTLFVRMVLSQYLSGKLQLHCEDKECNKWGLRKWNSRDV